MLLTKIPVVLAVVMKKKPSDVYFDLSEPEAFTGASRLQSKFPQKDVKEWLKSQPSYSLHKPLRRVFPTRKYKSSGPNDTWQLDLMEMIPYARVNKGYKYILTCLDIFSRFAQTQPVKTKQGKIVADAITKMLKSVQPRHVQTDLGKEFYNSHVQKLFTKHNINHYSVHSQFKAALVERFNRTLRERLNRFFTHQGNKKWVDALSKLTSAYNHSSHRSLKGKTPADVVKTTNLDDWIEQERVVGKKRKGKPYSLGTLVRISRIAMTPFRRNFDQNWSEEIFRISKIDTKQNPVMYILKDLNDEIIQGKFYHEELQDIGDELPNVYRIEKIIRTKGTGKSKKYFVKWYGYNDSHNSWISANSFV